MNFVAVSDLHIGLESEYSQKGIDFAQSAVADEMSRRVRDISVANGADGIILLGDLKHKVGSVSRQEWQEVPRFLTQLASTAAVYLVPGNHDSSIVNLVPSDIRVASAMGMVIEDTLFLHGHSMPSDLRSGVKNIVMGHVHPILRKKGSVIDGKPVWVYVRIDKSALFSGQREGEDFVDVVVVPSFNRQLYSYDGRAAGDFIAQRSRKSISPITARIIKRSDLVQRCAITTLDGSLVGETEMLREIL